MSTNGHNSPSERHQDDPPKSPTTPMADTPMTPEEPKPTTTTFKSSLQVLLQQRQERELIKNIEYKEKLEKGETEEEEEEEDEDEKRRNGEELKTEKDEGKKTDEETKGKQMNKEEANDAKEEKKKERKGSKVKEDKVEKTGEEKKKNKEGKGSKIKEDKEDKVKKKTKKVKEAKRAEDAKREKHKASGTKREKEGEKEKRAKAEDKIGQSDEITNNSEEEKERGKEKSKSKDKTECADGKGEESKEIYDKEHRKEHSKMADEAKNEVKEDGKMEEEEEKEEKKEEREQPENEKKEGKKTTETEEKVEAQGNEEPETVKEKQRKDGDEEHKKTNGGEEEEAKKKDQPEAKNEEEEERKMMQMRKADEGEKRKRTKDDKQEKEEGQEAKDKETQGLLLMKKKRPFGSWKRYYFVLDGSLLTYYRSQHDYENLGGLKGSLDLALVEEVLKKKPGIMRTHHPFCLSRRNLPSIHLAAETKEDQLWWMSVLQEVTKRIHRFSGRSSDQNLHTGASSPVSSLSFARSATLPARVQNFSNCSSSVSEGDEGEEEDEEEKEETHLVQPKKVLKVPIGMPLVKVNLDEVKLKKVEKKVEKDEKGSKEALDADSSADRDDEKTLEETEGRASPGTSFGVRLKRTLKKTEGEEAGEGREAVTVGSRRPTKQPVIPLNNKGLLNLPELQTQRVSPTIQRRPTPERKKSPSPSLPISKSVQALTKSAEEVKGKQVDTLSDKTTRENTAESEGELKKNPIICHAQTIELRYSDDMEILEDGKEIQDHGIKSKDSETQKKHDDDEEEEKMSKEEMEKEEDDKENKPDQLIKALSVKVDAHEGEDAAPSVSAVQYVSEDPKDDTVNKDLNRIVELAAQKEEGASGEQGDSHDEMNEESNRESRSEESEPSSLTHKESNAAMPLTPPASPVSSEASGDYLPTSKPSSMPTPSPEPAPPSPGQQNDGACDIGSSSEELRQSFQTTALPAAAVDVRSPAEKEKPEEATTPSGDSRKRVNTNDSLASCTSDPESTDRKSGKFKIFKNIRKGSVVDKDKKDNADNKEGKEKEKKRRGSHTFSKLLGKKGKDASKKPSEDEIKLKHDEATSEWPSTGRKGAAPLPDSPTTEPKVPSSPRVPTISVQAEPSEENVEAQLDAFLNIHNRSTDDDEVVIRRRKMVDGGEARCSTYSRTSTSSRDKDPPPSIPEKTRMRAQSPTHDVPQSNRPVTTLHLLNLEDEDEEEEENTVPVDGYISEEQIHALLSAKENREKKKRSRGRLLSDLVKPAITCTDTSDAWRRKRPSNVSLCSIESDEPLPTTNFLGWDRQSISSGSQVGLESPPTELEYPSDPLRRALRPTDSLTANKRKSLTSPEFTVQEEDGLSSPETSKAKSPSATGRDDEEMQEGKGRTGEESAEETMLPETCVDSESDTADAGEKSEQNDFFPVVGGDVELRRPAADLTAIFDTTACNLRTSGIVSLKKYLQDEEEVGEQAIRSGISRLGHSAAVEKLKQNSDEL